MKRLASFMLAGLAVGATVLAVLGVDHPRAFRVAEDYIRNHPAFKRL